MDHFGFGNFKGALNLQGMRDSQLIIEEAYKKIKNKYIYCHIPLPVDMPKTEALV